MLIIRKPVAAGAITEFPFAKYESPNVLIKNETDGEVLFCDAAFDEEKALHIPAHSWQAVNVAMFYDGSKAFYVKAAVDGNVEIDFGSTGAGSLDMVRLFTISGNMPIIALSEGENTTLTASVTRKYGMSEDLETPIALSNGLPIFVGDTVTIAASVEEGDVIVMLNESEVELNEDGEYSFVVVGNASVSSVKAESAE